jgi:ABC-2 type transport system permease protein
MRNVHGGLPIDCKTVNTRLSLRRRAPPGERLAGAVTRRGALLASVATVFVNISILWLATALGALVTGWIHGDMAFGECLYLSLAVVLPAALFAALAGVVCQLMPTVRTARLIGSSLLVFFLLLRIAADIQAGHGWLRWLTPLGWVEELHAFTGVRPFVLLLPLASLAGLLALCSWLAAWRDVGTGLLALPTGHRSSNRLLGSPTAAALRAESQTLLFWLLGTGLFALIVGYLSETAAELVRHSTAFRKIGSIPLTSAQGYIGYVFLFYVLAACLVATTNLMAAREEEGSERLEILLANPVSRNRWLGGRLVIAFLAATAVALVAGLLSWAGASTQNAPVELASMLGAAANCVPIAMLFLGLLTLVYGFVPRLTSGFAFSAIGLSFLWGLFGPLLMAPHWVLNLSPFHHVAAVPVQTIDAQSAAVMALVGVLALLAGTYGFRKRDLVNK